MKIFKFMVLCTFFFGSTAFGADNQWGFFLDIILEIFQNFFSYVFALVIIVIGIASVVHGATPLSAFATTGILVCITFYTPHFIKNIKGLAERWNPQVGIWQ